MHEENKEEEYYDDDDDYFEPLNDPKISASDYSTTENQIIAPNFTRPNDLVSDIVRHIGDSGVKMKCYASGRPEPNITWTRNQVPLNQASGNIHFSQWAISLDNVGLEDSGNYTCHVCNSVDCIDNTFNLLVLKTRDRATTPASQEKQLKAPSFTRPDDLTRRIIRPMGNMVKLKCFASGYPEPNITWTKNNEPIYKKFGQVHYGKWVVTLEDIALDDTGNYTCNICNVLGCKNFTFGVTVQGTLSDPRLSYLYSLI